MKIEFLEERKIHDIAIIRKFKYGDFNLTVTIDKVGPIEIQAIDKKQRFSITAINHKKANLLIENLLLTDDNDIQEFELLFSQVKNLLKFINEKRELLVKGDIK